MATNKKEIIWFYALNNDNLNCKCILHTLNFDSTIEAFIVINSMLMSYFASTFDALFS